MGAARYQTRTMKSPNGQIDHKGRAHRQMYRVDKETWFVRDEVGAQV